jgi:hypothetical protein
MPNFIKKQRDATIVYLLFFITFAPFFRSKKGFS